MFAFLQNTNVCCTKNVDVYACFLHVLHCNFVTFDGTWMCLKERTQVFVHLFRVRDNLFMCVYVYITIESNQCNKYNSLLIPTCTNQSSIREKMQIHHAPTLPLAVGRGFIYSLNISSDCWMVDCSRCPSSTDI